MVKKIDRSKATKNKSKKNKGKKNIPDNALQRKIDYNNTNPFLSFKFVDESKWKLEKWKGKELTDLIKCFKTIETIKWKEVLRHPGLNCKPVVNPPKINSQGVSPEVTIYEMRVCKKKRIMGFRDKDVFCITWFDRDHSICPEGKNRKYG